MNNMQADDDFNFWWYTHFEGYRALWGRSFDNLLEVGCGPHTNTRYILRQVHVKKVYLEDPLLSKYLKYNFGNSLFRRHKNTLYQLLINEGLNVDMCNARLEELPYKNGMMDLVICVNVLDHVADYGRCIGEMDRVLKPGGILVLGNDLSNSEDMQRCPESYTDIGHPIKVDHDTLNASLKGYRQLYYKIWPRNEGRNPRAHYGVFTGIFEKE